MRRRAFLFTLLYLPVTLPAAATGQPAPRSNRTSAWNTFAGDYAKALDNLRTLKDHLVNLSPLLTSPQVFQAVSTCDKALKVTMKSWRLFKSTVVE